MRRRGSTATPGLTLCAGGAAENDKKGVRKPVKRKEVKLGKLMGLADADEETQKAFGKGAEKADEMQYSIFRLRQLKHELAEQREQVLKEVRAPSSPPRHALRSSHRLRPPGPSLPRSAPHALV